MLSAIRSFLTVRIQVHLGRPRGRLQWLGRPDMSSALVWSNFPSDLATCSNSRRRLPRRIVEICVWWHDRRLIITTEPCKPLGNIGPYNTSKSRPSLQNMLGESSLNFLGCFCSLWGKTNYKIYPENAHRAVRLFPLLAIVLRPPLIRCVYRWSEAELLV